MVEKSFSIRELLRLGWETVKNNLWFFIGVTLTTVVLQGIPNILTRNGNPSDVQLIGSLLSLILQTILGIGTIRITLKSVRGEKAVFGDLFNFRPYFWKYFWASLLLLLIGIAIFAGMEVAGLIILGSVWRPGQEAIMWVIISLAILAAVPFTILAVRYGFFPFLIVDKGLGPVQSFEQSWSMTKGLTGRLILFTLAMVGVNLLGVLALAVGLLVTLPLTFLAEAYLYQRLSEPDQAA